MRLTIFTAILMFSSYLSALEISNFKSGLSCTDTKSFGWICHVTEDVFITGQSTCIWNKESKPCTWYGFSFDYKDYEKDTSIDCKYTTSELSDTGNPREIVLKNSNIGEYSLELTEKDGHFYNPQYMLLSVQTKNKSLIKNKTVCSFDGEKLFEFHLNIHLPIKG